MAGYWPPGFPYFTPPPSRWALSPPPPPPRPFHQTSPTSRDNSPSSPGGVIAAVAISVGVFLLVLTFVCSLCQGYPGAPATTAGRGAPRLPSFTYNRSVRHNVAGGGGEEAASCSVCLGAFQTGETVRLLPVCLHLFHVECIDPWLDAHSTCPICRSGTDPDRDGSLVPPV
ncbi:unnamed protein product [Urochloa humidicola]